MSFKEIMSGKRKMKVIYVVTSITFGFKYSNKTRSGDGKFHSYLKRTSPSQSKYFTIIEDRTWGWYADLKTAKQSVLENWCDIHETMYDHVVIEEIPETVIYGGELPKEWWYKWHGSCEKGGYKPWKKPKEYNNIIGFMNRMKQVKCHWSF